jgi:hypothetical protein
MLNIILRRALGVAAVGAGAAAVTAGARYFGSKRHNAAEKLAAALLEVARLEDAARLSATETEAALAACAAYLINASHEAASGITGPPTIDPVGTERKLTSDRYDARATVITTTHEPESRWQFEVEYPSIARVSGSRRLKSSKFTGPKVSMQTPDTLSIRFENGYLVNIESDMEFSTNVLNPTSRTKITGNAWLSDNRGNVSRLKIDNNGEVSGTITRGTEIVGRFEGSLHEGLTFRQYSGTTV